MRIIAGKAKGHRLKAPKRVATRPATDLVRGAIFSMLESGDNNWDLILDLYSGSGAMGIEALSRGAGWVDFVEHERLCCNVIKDNLQKTGFTAQSHIYCCDVPKAISFLEKEYDIILIDPPYSDLSIGGVLERLAASQLVGVTSTVVVTHSPRLKLGSSYISLALFKERRHGDSCIAMYRKEAGF